MKNNISSANLMAAMYFLGLSAQYAVERQNSNTVCVEDQKDTVSPEKFEDSLKANKPDEAENSL